MIAVRAATGAHRGRLPVPEPTATRPQHVPRPAPPRWPPPSAGSSLAVAFATAVGAKTPRWAGRGDPQTMDPYSQNENLTNNVNALVYDTLVMRDRTSR